MRKIVKFQLAEIENIKLFLLDDWVLHGEIVVLKDIPYHPMVKYKEVAPVEDPHKLAFSHWHD